MSYEFRQYYIPDRMLDGIYRYIQHGILPGSFLTAVLNNNLADAVAHADDENMANLPAYVAYFYNETPSLCWGSAERVRNWVQAKQTKV